MYKQIPDRSGLLYLSDHVHAHPSPAHIRQRRLHPQFGILLMQPHNVRRHRRALGLAQTLEEQALEAELGD